MVAAAETALCTGDGVMVLLDLCAVVAFDGVCPYVTDGQQFSSRSGRRLPG
jgi:hypothetical protein